MKLVKDFLETIIEREAIFVRKELLHLPKTDWTNDRIYKLYAFCNVHRNYDRTFRLLQKLQIKSTGLRVMLRWQASNPMLQWLLANKADPELKQAWDDANLCGVPHKLIKIILRAYRELGVPLVSGSFIVKRYGDDAEQMYTYYSVGEQFKGLLECGAISSTQEAVMYFRKCAPWCADFTAYCIVSDFIYLYPDHFTDLHTWTAFGPGAFRGINDIVGTTKKTYLLRLQDLKEEWTKAGQQMLNELCARTNTTEEELSALCEKENVADICYQLTHPLMLDVEHWLCEFHKYNRGYAKRIYKEKTYTLC